MASAEEYLSTTFQPSKGIFIDDLENKKNITRFAVEICPLRIPTHPKDIALPERAGVQSEPSAPKQDLYRVPSTTTLS